jgi:N-acetylmuramoyl-L-alanine amidase
MDGAKMGRLPGLLPRCIVIAICGLLFAAGFAMAAGRPVVSGVRAASHDGITRFVLDLSDPVAFTVSAGEANQVVVDFPDLDWQSDYHNLRGAVGLLKDFRYGARAPGTGRLVLETGGAAVVQKAFLIPPAAGANYRFVLDLVAAGTVAGPVTAPPPSFIIAAPVPPAPPAPPPPTPVAVTPTPQLRPQLAVVSPNYNPNPNPILSPKQGLAPAEGSLTHLGPPVASGPIPAPILAAPVPVSMPSSPAAAAHALAPPPQPLAEPASLPMGKAERKQSHAGKPIVVIDPGHGGVDPGATSLTGAYEKNIVLALGREVKAQLDKGNKVKCLLTRDRDVFIPLRERVAIGRAANADLFMSLHADTVADPEIRGLSVYTLSQHSSDSEAQALADKENKADIVAGIDLSNESPEVTNILIDLVQRESMNLSAVVANHIIQEVQRETRQLLQNTHRFAGFAVLKAPDVPSVLVETGYLSNQLDEQMLRRPEYRAKLATALARAIEQYFAQTQKTRRP